VFSSCIALSSPLFWHFPEWEGNRNYSCGLTQNFSD
jgi:hypothetical protein